MLKIIQLKKTLNMKDHCSTDMQRLTNATQSARINGGNSDFYYCSRVHFGGNVLFMCFLLWTFGIWGGFVVCFFFNYTFERFLGEWGMVLSRTAEVLQLLTKGPPCSVQTFAFNLSFLITGIHILETVRKKR